jgi:hypothetical protein
MGLLETLILGSYAYTTWLLREVWKLKSNHLKHLDQRISVLEETERRRHPFD